jgi:hypothetical protein
MNLKFVALTGERDMSQTEPDVSIEVLDSITKLTDDHRGQVVIAASHGAEYAAYLAAKGGARAVILNNAGVGKNEAGISGLPYLEALGIPAATVSHRSARIGDGADMLARGTISHVNRSAETLGCVTGQSCKQCADHLRAAPAVTTKPPAQSENRILLRQNPGEPEVWGLDSISLILPEDKNRIVISGSHGEALGGKPETALKYDAIAAVFNDAGIGIDKAGLSRLPALDSRQIPAATVFAKSARIGDGRSIYEDGVISCVNETAAALGVTVGMRTPKFVERVIASLNRG